MAHWAMLSLAVEFSVFQTHLRRLGTRQTIFGVPCWPIFFLFFGQVDTSKGNSYHVWESEKNLKSCCLVNSSVLSLMNMFGICQCKTRTTDYCFSTCKWERDNNSPLFLTLKTMVRSHSAVCILNCPVWYFTHECMLLSRLVTHK